MTGLGIGLAIITLVAALFVHPAFLVTAMFIIGFDIWLLRDYRKGE